MHIRTFVAPSLQEALVEIRRQMGPDATVLHTRDVRQGVRGLFGQGSVEVTAGLRTGEESESAGVGQSLDSHDYDILQSLSEQLDALSRKVDGMGVPDQHQFSGSSSALDELLTDWAVSLTDAHWIENAFPWKKSSSENMDAVLSSWLEHRIQVSGPIQVSTDQQTVVALVGPTGVGKTTTIAKLAAGFRLEQRRSVGLITIDTFRTAAIDQLQKYAMAMELPMEVVSSGEQMFRALESFRELDLVLIDTIGRSPRDEKQIAVTGKLLDAAEPNETHLVLSATSSARVLESAAKRFAPLRPCAAIVTKVDEVQRQPDLVWFARDGALPLSYITNGQHVPADIDVATSHQLVKLLSPSQSGTDSDPALPAGRNLLATTN